MPNESATLIVTHFDEISPCPRMTGYPVQPQANPDLLGINGITITKLRFSISKTYPSENMKQIQILYYVGLVKVVHYYQTHL